MCLFTVDVRGISSWFNTVSHFYRYQAMRIFVQIVEAKLDLIPKDSKTPFIDLKEVKERA